jgi:hypothetical protein
VVISQIWGGCGDQSGHCGNKLPGFIKIAFSSIGGQSTLNRSHTQQVNRVAADHLYGWKVRNIGYLVLNLVVFRQLFSFGGIDARLSHGSEVQGSRSEVD